MSQAAVDHKTLIVLGYWWIERTFLEKYLREVGDFIKRGGFTRVIFAGGSEARDVDHNGQRMTFARYMYELTLPDEICNREEGLVIEPQFSDFVLYQNVRENPVVEYKYDVIIIQDGWSVSTLLKYSIPFIYGDVLVIGDILHKFRILFNLKIGMYQEGKEGKIKLSEYDFRPNYDTKPRKFPWRVRVVELWKTLFVPIYYIPLAGDLLASIEDN